MNLGLCAIKGFLPEIIIISTIVISTVLAFLTKNDKREWVYFSSLSGVLLSLLSFVLVPVDEQIKCFSGNFVSDYFSLLFRFLILFGTLISLQISRKYSEKFDKFRGEFLVLLLCASLGAMLMSGANDLVMSFVAIETLGISVYALSGFAKNDRLSSEAGLKYLIFGGASTAVSLYGFSLLYGITGATDFAQISAVLQGYTFNPVLFLSFIMIMLGLGFKVSAVPFHSWTPDVYDGSPLPVAAYLSVISKIAGFVLIARFLTIIFYELSAASIILGFIAVLTMSIGNLMALKQKNIKRLMAYSSIAQAGYVILGLAVVTEMGLSAVIFYMICYLFMNFGAWAAIELFVNKTGKTQISDFVGLAYKNPLLAFGLTVCMLSLAGIPITAGFIGKFYLFKTILFSGLQYLWMLIFALLNTLLSVYYYLKVVKSIFTVPENSKENIMKFFIKSGSLRSAYIICFVFVVLIGFLASPLITISQNAAATIYIEQKLNKTR